MGTKLSLVQREQPMQRRFTGQAATDRVNDSAGFNVNLTFGHGDQDSQNTGIAPQALDLNQVRQADLLQGPGETLPPLPREQVVQDIEHKLQTISGHGFFQEKFRACRQTLYPV